MRRGLTSRPTEFDMTLSWTSQIANSFGRPFSQLVTVCTIFSALLFSARSSERITPLLRDLHWLRVPERIQFRVPPLCSDVPLSQRHSSVLPHWQYLPGSWRRGPPSPALVSHSNSDRTACQAINPGRPIVLCRRSTGMEQSAASRTGCIVAHYPPTRTENIPFSLEFSGPLVTNSLFPIMFYACILLTV